jgi:hypothetical protein
MISCSAVSLRENGHHLEASPYTHAEFALGFFLCGSRGEEFFAFGDEAFLPGAWHGKYGAGARRQFVEGEGVGGAELLLPFGGTEDVPVLDGDPEDAGDIRSGEDAVDFKEFVVALWASDVGDDAGLVAGLFEPDPGKHLAADVFVAYPEDEAAELYSLHDMREGKEIGADAFGVHAAGCSPGYGEYLVQLVYLRSLEGWVLAMRISRGFRNNFWLRSGRYVDHLLTILHWGWACRPFAILRLRRIFG